MKFKNLVLMSILFLTPLFAQKFNNDVQNSLNQITVNELKSHILFLADDLLGGRKSGQYGNDVAAKYIASQFEAMGLKQGNGDSYFQPFKLIGIQMDHNMKLSAIGKNGSAVFNYYTEFIGFCGRRETSQSIKDAELVFVGYGIQAPEYNWDDFKGLDVKGKILLIMNNDPSNDPKLFEGKTRLYYGRWDYKYEKAAELGALGAIIIHTTPSASYGWNVIQGSWSSEECDLFDNKAPKTKLEGWLTEESSHKIVKLGGLDLDDLLKAAEKREFKPVPLNVKVFVDMKSSITDFLTRNVIGIIPGSDPKLKDEYIVYTSHYDHLGIGAPINGDSIYNGAFDNATGVSSILNIAKAFQTLKQKPKRSIMIIATAAEEEGTLGSQYFCQNPTVPSKQLIANLNIDAVNIWGIAKNVELIGAKFSDLYQTVEKVAKKMDMYVVDDQNPEAGGFYRSDQLHFAKIGVPACYFSNGDDFIGKPRNWGKEQGAKFVSENYHQPSDEVKDWWNYDGMVKNTQLYFLVGLTVANDPKVPQWKKGNEFSKIRK